MAETGRTQTEAGGTVTDGASGDIARLSIDTIRFLAIEMVERAKSGHPGAPMGMAPMAYTLWTRHLRHHPGDPSWPDRDRFVLSAGHASAMLYALLHLTGYDLSIDELKRFRQYGSLTPGHPESDLTPGVEATTGPLGQGFANGVGMAIAESWLANRFNAPRRRIIDHHIYAICSDGDLQEGISSEAASLAGTLKLGNLVYLYDDNGIQIEGSTDMTFTEDVGKRFEAFGWHVVGPVEGTDVEAIDSAIAVAKAETERPSLVIVKTHIGHGSPNKQDTASAHGEPLGETETAATREALGWSHAPFEVPEAVRKHMNAVDRGAALKAEWEERVADLAQESPEKAFELAMLLKGDLPESWDAGLDGIFRDADPASSLPTRKASGKTLNHLAGIVPNLMGGSADLGGSNNTIIAGRADYSAEDRGGVNFHFGVREHAMGAIASGMALHGGVIPYTGTFLTFSDYMRPAIRLAALQKLRVVYVFTHDSIGLGEDGPTHQPIEHLAALRAIPGLRVIRPSDATEVPEAWRLALSHREGPTALVLTRQKVAIIDRERWGGASGLRRGAYVLRDGGASPALAILATGSEVELALSAADALANTGVAARVVAMPCWELFRDQPLSYRDEVLPDGLPRLAVEAGVALGWHEWIGPLGETVTLDRFGVSAPAADAFRGLGFSTEAVVSRALRLLGRNA
jgi:transketolase